MAISAWKKQEIETKKLAARKATDLADAVKSLVQASKHYRRLNFPRANEVTKKLRAAIDILAGESALYKVK